MEENKVSGIGREGQVRRSADVVSIARAQESQKEGPLICDPYAHLFVSPEGEEMLRSALGRWPFFAEYLVVRDKFFDEHLRVLCEKEDVKQMVSLGAGNDMRAARLDFLKGRKVFEVDLPDQITAKKAILKSELGKLPEEVTYVGTSVTEPGFMLVLQKAGFVPEERSVFIVEGLIYYLSSEGVDCFFDELSHLPSLRNLFLVDHISIDFSQKALDPEKRGKPPYPENVLSYLSNRGFSIRESALLGNLTGKYCGKNYQEKWWVVAAIR
jgi:methyltransferase (TIGR00027 family)